MNRIGTCTRGLRVSLETLALIVASMILPGLDAATVRGRITECAGAVGAAGYVVKAFEEVRFGIPDLTKPCTITSRPARLVGTDTAGSDGGYSISFAGTRDDPEFCLFDDKVFIRVFLPDGQTLVHTSTKKAVGSTVTFNFDTGVMTACPQVLLPVSLDLDPSIVSGGPPALGRLVFQQSGGSSPEATTVALFASDPEGIVMESTVVVPAGARTAEFTVGADIPGGKIVTIFASANGATVSADLAVRPDGPMKGFINPDDRRDISDAVFLLNFLFAGGEPPPFMAFADVNGSLGIDISDAVALLGFLFAGAPVSALCESDPSTLPSGVRLGQQVVTDGEEVLIHGDFPDPDYRIVLKGFSFPNGRLISGNQVLGERRLNYCTCLFAVRSTREGPDQFPFLVLPFSVPLDAPSGEYEVYVLPGGGSCPGGNALATGCLEDDCAIGPMKLFVEPSHIVSLWEELVVNNSSEDSGDTPAELFFTFASQTGEPDATLRFPVQFADSWPSGRVGSKHLNSGKEGVFLPFVPVFAGREVDMERTECEEECLSDPDPVRCRAICAEAARRMSNSLATTIAGAEFDCLQGCSSIWDEVAGIGVAALGCFAASKTGNFVTGCSASITLGGLVQAKLEDAVEGEDDALGTAEIQFPKGPTPFWSVGSRFPLSGLVGASGDIDVGVFNYRLPGLRIVESRFTLQSVTLIEADDESCDAPDELFFETRASLGLNGRLGEATRFPSSSGLSCAEGQTLNLTGSNFSLSAGSNAESSLLYVEIGVWDFDGEDEHELIGLHSTTYMLGQYLEPSSNAVSDFIVDGRERRRVVIPGRATVTGWNSGERCSCSGFGACAFDPRIPHGIANISYEIQVTWEKYPQ